VYGLAAVVSRGLVFLILPLYVRALSPYDIGLYELFNSISLLLAVILPLEITQAIARLKSNSNLDQQGIKNQSTTAFTFTLVSFGIFGAIALVLIILFGGGYLKEGISILVPIFAITLLLLNGAYYFLQNELRWSMQPRIYLWSTFINALVASSVSFLFLGFSNLGIIGLYLALNLGLLAGIATIIFKAPNLLNVRWKWDELISLLKFSIPLTFSSAFLVIASVIDRFVLSYSLNLDTLGKYSVSLRVSAMAMLMLQGLQMAVLPIILGNADQMNRKKNIEKSLRFFLIIGFTVAFQLSAAAPEIMTLIATNAYSDGALLVPIILVGSVLSAVYPFAPGLWLLGFTWRMAILGMALAILSFIFSAAMVPIFGEIGASLAYALSGLPSKS